MVFVKCTIRALKLQQLGRLVTFITGNSLSKLQKHGCRNYLNEKIPEISACEEKNPLCWLNDP